MSHKALAVQKSVSSHANTPLATRARGWRARFGALLAVVAMSLFQDAPAQAGAIDTSFNPVDNGAYGDGANQIVNRVVLQPDGKALITGEFSSYNGTPRLNIARLNIDGSLDTSFDPGTGIGFGVRSLALQPDGKVLIGGLFLSYNGTPRARVARINTNGSLDTSFDPGLGANNQVSAFAVQPDGKIIIGGLFTSYNGTPRNRIARLNADGSLDTSFNPGTGATFGSFQSSIQTLALQSDGRVLIGGEFNSYNGIARNSIARINGDGSLDTSFDPGTGTTRVESIVLQPDGKILIGGGMGSYNGIARKSIARVNSDGSLDTSFNPGTGAVAEPFATSSPVLDIALQPDGKVLIGGRFLSYNGILRNRIARINADGSLDASFNPGAGANSDVKSLALQADGRMLVAGSFNFYDDRARNCLVRVDVGGGMDASFNPRTGADAGILSFAVQNDGKLMIGGFFTIYNDTPRSRIARLNGDGALDAGFNPGTGANNTVSALASQPDGKVLIGGNFTNYNGINRLFVARVRSDGSLDTSFDPGLGANNAVNALAVQPDGKVLIGGNFSNYNGIDRRGIARVNSDGSLDLSFNSGTGTTFESFAGNVQALALQSDGKVLLAGTFSAYNGTPSNYMARVNADGSLDTSFNAGFGTNGIRSLALQPDGKVLIAGVFTSYNGIPCNRIARLHSNGSLDLSFSLGLGASGEVSAIVVQPDGKIIIGGQFTSYNGTPCNRIARLNADGGLDTSFNIGTGLAGSLTGLGLQPGGEVLIGGYFSSYNGTKRNRITRLFGNDCNLDTDSDGTLNCADGCPTDPLKIAPGICGCGVADTDTDADGTADCNDGCPNDPLKVAPGICGCGVADTDTDADGTADCIDGCPNDPLKVAPGICGCGVADTDTDSDGTADCNDGCPTDPLKIAPGICG